MAIERSLQPLRTAFFGLRTVLKERASLLNKRDVVVNQWRRLAGQIDELCPTKPQFCISLVNGEISAAPLSDGDGVSLQRHPLGDISIFIGPEDSRLKIELEEMEDRLTARIQANYPLPNYLAINPDSDLAYHSYHGNDPAKTQTDLTVTIPIRGRFSGSSKSAQANLTRIGGALAHVTQVLYAINPTMDLHAGEAGSSY